MDDRTPRHSNRKIGKQQGSLPQVEKTYTVEETIHKLKKKYCGAFANNAQSDLATEIISQLKKQSANTNITLDFSKFYCRNIKSIAPVLTALQMLPNITSLDLRFYNASPLHLNTQMISELSKTLQTNTTLKSLSFSAREESCPTIAKMIENNKGIKSLTLETVENKRQQWEHKGPKSWRSIWGEEIIAKALTNNKTLTELNMPNAHEEAAVRLAEALKGNKTIKTLGFGSVSNFASSHQSISRDYNTPHYCLDKFINALKDTSILEVKLPNGGAIDKPYYDGTRNISSQEYNSPSLELSNILTQRRNFETDLENGTTMAYALNSKAEPKGLPEKSGDLPKDIQQEILSKYVNLVKQSQNPELGRGGKS
jgi:hypothetical protein